MNLYEEIVKRYKPLEPIFFEDLLTDNDAKSTLATRLNKLVVEGLLKKHSRGIYYLGKYDEVLKMDMNLTTDSVIEAKYIKNNKDTYGFIGETNLLNMYKFTTQVPMVTTIITNNETSRKREIHIGKLYYYIKKAHCMITNDNYRILKFLEFVNYLSFDDFEMDKQENFWRLKDMMNDNKLRLKDVKKYISYYPAKVSKRIMEVENEITRR